MDVKSFRSHLPIFGIIISASLFLIAATYYPGGTTDSATSVGYNWAHNFICSLFAANALNGKPNPARIFAIPAMLVLCVSIGALFQSISHKSTSNIHRKMIQIGGIGSAVYFFLVVTPMHNLMINIALLFTLIAQLATLHLLYIKQQWLLLFAGSTCLVLLFLTAFMYYENVLFGLLPIMQKVSLVAGIGWLIATHYTHFHQESQNGLPRTRQSSPPDEIYAPSTN